MLAFGRALLLLCSLLMLERAALADLITTGIIDSVAISRVDIGAGLDAITITVNVGSDTFSVLDGGFAPINGNAFNQAGVYGADATPAAVFFNIGLVPLNDTTFLLPASFGDPLIDGPNTDTASELSTVAIGYFSMTGEFGLARLVLPNGAGFEVASVSGTVFDTPTIALIRGGAVVGTISGSVAAVPEPNSLVMLTSIGFLLVSTRRTRRQYRDGL